MYENGYDYDSNNRDRVVADAEINSETSSTTSHQSQGRGTYTDYVSYSSNAGSGTSGGNNDGKKNKTKKIMGIIALVMAGVLVGSLVCYTVMNTRFNASFKINGEEMLPQKEQSSDANADDDTSSAFDDIFDFAQGKDDEEATEDEKVEELEPFGDSGSEIATTGASSDMTVAQIAQKCLPSVVAITNMSETQVRSFWGESFVQQSESAGSGIIIGETDEELLILTNYHVVADNVSLSVVFNGEENKGADDASIINAVIKDYDQTKDIAVLSVKMSDITPTIQANISVATIGNSEDLVLGEQIVAIGNALGYGQSVTTGIISALNRQLEINSTDGISSDNVFIQTDAAINPGNSGGAMFNMRGELVGVNSAKSGGTTVEGMGYAIPISDIMDEVSGMMTSVARETLPEEQRGYLGVSIVDVTDQISQMYDLPVGVYVSAVSSGLAAEAAGIEKGDIIVGIEGKEVANSTELKKELAYYAKGEKVTLTIKRNAGSGYEEKNVLVVLGDLGE